MADEIQARSGILVEGSLHPHREFLERTLSQLARIDPERIKIEDHEPLKVRVRTQGALTEREYQAMAELLRVTLPAHLGWVIEA